MVRQKSLYQSAVAVSQDFLGPAGERFIARQIVTHLGIEPEDLQAKHMKRLVKWVRITFSVLTNDTALIKEFSGRLLALAPTKATNGRTR